MIKKSGLLFIKGMYAQIKHGGVPLKIKFEMRIIEDEKNNCH